jgi:hypothetical protein
MQDFNFDDWAKLYREDPFEFDRQRSIVLAAVIAEAPVKYQQKLYEIQEQCDSLHNTLSPIDATIEMSKLMYSNAGLLQTKLAELGAISKKL